MSSIRVFRDELPTISLAQRQQAFEALPNYGVSALQALENASRCMAILVRDRFLDGQPGGKPLTVVAGPGFAGEVAAGAARRLSNWGAKLTIYQKEPAPVLQRLGCTVLSLSDLPQERLDSEAIMEGIIGAEGNATGEEERLIAWLNRQPAPKVSVEAPSGAASARTKARATLSLGLPLDTLYEAPVLDFRGELYLADISIPSVLWDTLGVQLPKSPLFAESDVLRLP
ncbi:NAD(P)H-hydrate epimerase [Phaeodactylibacter luteus]|uniref:YjeF N-terminal domain-containing protein n=1 Tax=Phaeodactylibacter luteus TaxID=1564516 RepID=A0A5C6RVC5_9BACT|nr:NAD(P)H-hydrate epimerase [Phaeodactylibacter luteus]TXB66318.1 hypothetical protein FRY97_05760 [Phaeodactylibacter luteus]